MKKHILFLSISLMVLTRVHAGDQQVAVYNNQQDQQLQPMQTIVVQLQQPNQIQLVSPIGDAHLVQASVPKRFFQGMPIGLGIGFTLGITLKIVQLIISAKLKKDCFISHTFKTAWALTTLGGLVSTGHHLCKWRRGDSDANTAMQAGITFIPALATGLCFSLSPSLNN